MNPFVVILGLLATVPASADTLDWRNCTPHSPEDSADYRAWLLSKGMDPKEAEELAASFQRGDTAWGDALCEVPLHSAYGTLSSCVLWQNDGQRKSMGHDGNFSLLTSTSLEGLEWGCNFGLVFPIEPPTWRVAAECAEAGEDQDGRPIPITQMIVIEAADKTSATVMEPVAQSGVEGWTLTLPSCNLPYEQQLRLELQRLERELER
jgi:hypothetical protein